MAIYFKKKYFRDDINKPDGVIAWQFTKENYSLGAPSFVRRYLTDRGSLNSEFIHLWSQYGGDVIGGELNINGVITPIYEGDYIVKLRTDMPIEVASRSKFEQYYYQFETESKFKRFYDWLFKK